MNNTLCPDLRTINHGHLYCGLGGGAKGFNRGHARVGNMMARFECKGGIDVDAAAIRDFERMTGVKGTVLDMFSREQYIAFHDKNPPADWREATPDDIRRAMGGAHLHILFLSAPCKGFSGLLSAKKSQSAKYAALNRLTLRGIWLALEAYKNDPIELIVFENVPRIAARGRELLDQITALLRSYGYIVAETTHDCGELGGLAQTRKRFLLVARHQERVPSFLYQPDKRPLKSVGELLSRMPRPGDPLAGPMHRVPRLQFKTWVRLAFIEAGKDWRSLNRLAVEDGFLRDYLLMPETAWRDDALGVLDWKDHAMTIAGRSTPTNGRYAVADPTPHTPLYRDALGVTPYDEPAGTVTSRGFPLNGAFSVADPRTGYPESAHHNVFRVVSWDNYSNTITGGSHPAGAALSVADPIMQGERHKNVFRVIRYGDTAGTVTGGGHPSSGGQAVADPKLPKAFKGKYTVTDYEQPGGTVLSRSMTAQGCFAVADPLPGWGVKKDSFMRGHYGVIGWGESSRTVTSSGQADNSYSSVADPLLFAMPEANEHMVAYIRSMDNTWHRPFTTLELAVLQGLINPEEHLELEGGSDSGWRERIGNAVPPPAAQAIAGVMGEVLLLTWAGETFSMSQSPIWVRPVAAALMAARNDEWMD